jgi:hypothetical protein
VLLPTAIKPVSATTGAVGKEGLAELDDIEME